MSTTIKIKFYSDPGHGWGAVKRKVLSELEISDKISTFSYQKGQTVYLEEDSDLQKFVTALTAKGAIIKYDEHNTDRRSPIRSYDRYRP